VPLLPTLNNSSIDLAEATDLSCSRFDIFWPKRQKCREEFVILPPEFDDFWPKRQKCQEELVILPPEFDDFWPERQKCQEELGILPLEIIKAEASK
jgi:hypothetical protein